MDSIVGQYIDLSQGWPLPFSSANACLMFYPLVCDDSRVYNNRRFSIRHMVPIHQPFILFFSATNVYDCSSAPKNFLRRTSHAVNKDFTTWRFGATCSRPNCRYFNSRPWHSMLPIDPFWFSNCYNASKPNDVYTSHTYANKTKKKRRKRKPSSILQEET